MQVAVCTICTREGRVMESRQAIDSRASHAAASRSNTHSLVGVSHLVYAKHDLYFLPCLFVVLHRLREL